MKKFDGIHPYTYSTIFGLVKIEFHQEYNYPYMYSLEQVTTTHIKNPRVWSNGTIGGRIFQNRTQAYQYSNELEQEILKEVKKLIENTMFT